MARTYEEQVNFMNKMIETYKIVHNQLYWDEISPFIRSQASGRVLDIGCGPGLLLKDIFDKYNSEMIFAVDLSDVMLEKAKETLKEAGDQNKLTLIQKHMQEDPSLPENLNIIFASRVLRSFSDQWVVMKSIRDSLVDDGLLVILDWSKESIYTYHKYFENNGKYSVDPKDVIQYHRNFSRYDLNDWEYILLNTGFSVLHAFQVNEVTNCLVAKKSSN